MQILLVSATELEIAPLLSQQLDVDHLVTGVGVAATVYSLTRSVVFKKYDLIIQAGIGGSFSEELPPGETVLIKKEVFADAGALEGNRFFSLFDMGLANKDAWPYTDGWLENNNLGLNSYGLQTVNGITVNTVTDEQKITGLYKAKYNAAIESMEGAAFHYVCLQEKIPFIQIRAVSNYVGERNKDNWKIKLAIENLNLECKRLIENVSPVNGL